MLEIFAKVLACESLRPALITVQRDKVSVEK
jgi:hypothetical protein